MKFYPDKRIHGVRGCYSNALDKPFTVGKQRYRNVSFGLLYTEEGFPFYGWTWEMPRVPDQILDSVFYLYPSFEGVLFREEYGGTGFFVWVESEMHEGRGHLYAVTNNHVIEEGYASNIVINAEFDMKVIHPVPLNQWIPHPDGDDLAIAIVGGLNDKRFKHSAIPTYGFLTKEMAAALNLGAGHEVFMVGRFVHHAGRYINTPSVRSGIISVMPRPHEGIEFYEGGFQQEAYLVEMRSISGYSGSPVFFRLPAEDLQGRQLEGESARLARTPWLLGVDCGNFKYYDKVYEVHETQDGKRYEKTNLEAKSHSGQAIVIPSWKLLELLNDERVVMARKEADKRVEQAKHNSPVELDVNRKPQENASITQDAFEGALRHASRKTSTPDDKEKSEEI